MESFIPIMAAAWTFAVHCWTVRNGIVWDDRAALLMNPDATGGRPIMETFVHDFWGQDITAIDSHKSYRPIAVLSLRLNHAIHGLSPAGYHLTNVILHSLVVYLFSVFTGRLLRKERGVGGRVKMLHILTSAVFSCHPIHTEPISCIVGRSDILCATFFLLALILHQGAVEKDRTKWGTMSVSTLLGILAALCKELGATVFGVFVAHEIIIALSRSQPEEEEEAGGDAGEKGRGRGRSRGKKGGRGRSSSEKDKTEVPKKEQVQVKLESFSSMVGKLFIHFTSPQPIARTAINLTVPVAVISLHMWLHGNHKMYKWSILENDISLMEVKSHRVMSYMMVHSLYLWKLFNPFTLCYDYGWACIAPVVSIFDYRNVLSLGAYLLIVAFGVYGGMIGDAIYLWAGALLVVPFIPASNAFFPVGTVLGERLLYLPSIGFCLGVPVVAWDLSKTYLGVLSQAGKVREYKGKGKTNGINSSKARLTRIVLAAIVIPFSIKCLSRGREWRDEKALFEAAMGVCPTSLKILNNLALTLLNKETAPRAGRLLDEALELFPDYPSALFNRGLVHFVLKEEEQATEYFERSLAIDVNQPKTRAYLAQSYLTIAFDLQKKGEWDKAMQLIHESKRQADAAIQTGCKLPMVFQVRCSAGHELKLGEESLWYCDMAIQINDELKASGGDPNEMIKTENSHNAAALILRALDRVEEAAERYRLGLAIAPDSFELLVNAGGLLGDAQKPKEAMEYYSKALAIEPNSPELITNIGWLLELEGHLIDARAHYVKALELMKPHSHPQIVNNLKNIEVRIEQQMGIKDETLQVNSQGEL